MYQTYRRVFIRKWHLERSFTQVTRACVSERSELSGLGQLLRPLPTICWRQCTMLAVLA